MKVLQPGATIGMLGGGQLGRMFCVAAREMGYKVHVYTDEEKSPAGHVSDKLVCASYLDEQALAHFAAEVDVVTLEFENIPVETIKILSRTTPVYPGAETLYVAQNREREKQFLAVNGFPVGAFALIKSADQLTALEQIGFPAVLKTAGFGYDGKGQRIVRNMEEAKLAFSELGKFSKQAEVVAESLITIDKEFSVIGARNYQANETVFAYFGPIENKHVNHILDVSSVPARLSQHLVEQAANITSAIMDKLDCVGLLCVEFFLSDQGVLLVNELAPRPHNSGHLTIEACPTSQFEQQVRAVCGLTLGATVPFHSAAMVNLLGDLWLSSGQPNFAAALAISQAHLHLYGKEEARAGRKMGHITTVAESSSLAVELALRARASL
ncbi:MAG: 5-(carboxyamino)imidazole ribonucleotide synthase [Candidatus Obscuribacterales bacterium]